MSEQNQNIPKPDSPDPEIPKDSSWYDSGVMKIIGVISAVITVAAIIFVSYNQYHKIPSLEAEIRECKDNEIRLNKKIAYLNSTSEVSRLSRENAEKERTIRLLQEQLKEVKGSRDKINNLNTALSSDIKIAQNNLNACNVELHNARNKEIILKNDVNLLNLIEDTRRKIEKNNTYINENGYYKPTPTQIETWRLDNQNLNVMIQTYQQKLSCR